MSYIADVVANTPILSTWGNQIRDRVLMPFASAAERAAQWLTPPTGAISHQADTLGKIWIYNGTAWVLANSGGILAQSSDATAQSVPIAPTVQVLANTTLTAAVPAGRKLRVTGSVQYGLAANAAGTGQIVLQLVDAGTTVLEERWASMVGAAATGMSQTIALEKIITPSVAQTYTVRLRTFMNTPGATANFAQRSNITLEDCGPV